MYHNNGPAPISALLCTAIFPALGCKVARYSVYHSRLRFCSVFHLNQPKYRFHSANPLPLSPSLVFWVSLPCAFNTCPFFLALSTLLYSNSLSSPPPLHLAHNRVHHPYVSYCCFECCNSTSRRTVQSSASDVHTRLPTSTRSSPSVTPIFRYRRSFRQPHLFAQSPGSISSI